MKVQRDQLVSSLQEAAIGLSPSGLLEQSDCFIFSGGRIITFNDEIMVSAKSVLDLELAVPAADLLKLLSRWPDTEVEITATGSELVLQGKKRKAGLACATEILLPFDSVPKAEQWSVVPEATNNALQQAARTCGKDQTLFLTTCVHVTSSIIEACDNHRLYRATGKTGFKSEVLLPASTLSQLSGKPIRKVSIVKGWTHFRLKSGVTVSLRCYQEKYHESMADILEMKDATEVTFPANVADLLSRAEVMLEKQYDSRVNIAIEKGQLVMTSRKDAGWYEERKKIRYSGQALRFGAHPQFLSDILKQARKVFITRGKLKIEGDGQEFVVVLYSADHRTKE